MLLDIVREKLVNSGVEVIIVPEYLAFALTTTIDADNPI